MSYIHTAVVTAFGSGFIKFAPGTWGTLVGSILLLLFWQAGWLTSPWVLVALTVGITALGYYCITKLPDTWIHDDQRIVIDEVVGLWMTMCFIPISWKTIFLSFMLFRFYDIFKPLGIRYFDKLQSDWGVMIDDLIAGIYANITLRIVIVALSAYGYQ